MSKRFWKHHVSTQGMAGPPETLKLHLTGVSVSTSSPVLESCSLTISKHFFHSMALMIKTLRELETLCKFFPTLRALHLPVSTFQSLPSLTRNKQGQFEEMKGEKKHTFIIPLAESELPCKECKTDSIRENKQKGV